jgi:hypothetical protein
MSENNTFNASDFFEYSLKSEKFLTPSPSKTDVWSGQKKNMRSGAHADDRPFALATAKIKKINDIEAAQQRKNWIFNSKNDAMTTEILEIRLGENDYTQEEKEELCAAIIGRGDAVGFPNLKISNDLVLQVTKDLGPCRSTSSAKGGSSAKGDKDLVSLASAKGSSAKGDKYKDNCCDDSSLVLSPSSRASHAESGHDALGSLVSLGHKEEEEKNELWCNEQIICDENGIDIFVGTTAKKKEKTVKRRKLVKKSDKNYQTTLEKLQELPGNPMDNVEPLTKGSKEKSFASLVAPLPLAKEPEEEEDEEDVTMLGKKTQRKPTAENSSASSASSVTEGKEGKGDYVICEGADKIIGKLIDMDRSNDGRIHLKKKKFSVSPRILEMKEETLEMIRRVKFEAEKEESKIVKLGVRQEKLKARMATMKAERTRLYREIHRLGSLCKAMEAFEKEA